MAKIFRLFNIQGNNNIVDWQETKVYGSQAISEITDPDGADAKKEITSIPSPFARIDLIKTAFREVVDMANRKQGEKGYASFDSNTIYHKMVSDALDVAEIFFNYDRFKDKFEIVVWDKNKDLDPYSVLGKTLDRYLKSDAKGDDPYNFSKLERIYMLNYIGPDRHSSMNIVGATSPATLFFSSANDLSYVSKNVSLGTDKPFDSIYQPLYKRDFEFQKYLYSFRIAYGEGKFHQDFPEIDDYLISKTGKVCNYRLLAQEQKNEIDHIDANSIGQYEQIHIGENGADILEILGRTFHKRSNSISWQSDFEIDSDLYTAEKKPLVLPVESGNTYEKLRYTTDNWGKENKAPYYDNKPWIDRRLPNVCDEYPYLTISDFLEDTIVRMPYEINKDSFFDGNIDRADGKSYLLPLTDLFFQFFSTEQLKGTTKDGKKIFELKNNAGGITVVLRVPIKNGKHIEYRRTYFEAVNPDVKNNDGGLVDKTFGLGIMPLIQFPENVKKHYRIALFDLDTRSTGVRDIHMTFCKLNMVVPIQSYCIRDRKDIEMAKSSIEASAINDNFDRIIIQVGSVKCVLVPKFIVQRANSRKQFTYAVDFGTTNTHIEYAIDGGNPETFNINENEKQFHKLYGTFFSIQNVIENDIEHNFIPDKIADNTQFTFPMRTAFSENNEINYDMQPSALVDGNVPFLYEKKVFPYDYNVLKTDLKWSGVPDKLVRLFLENLFLLMRNKVLLNGGNLDITKIIWFYPASMDEGRVIKFNKIWNDLYKAYFGNESSENVISISESAAPFQYYRKKQGAKSEVVTIDIGGGTTDVYVVENSLPKMLLSFRFASEALFGDAFNWDSDNNGFVNLYKEKFTEVLESNDLSSLGEVLRQIERKKKSPDIIAFFFSLTTNKDVKGNEALSFLEQLSANDRLRYTFIIFYGAILYFIAKAMKAKGLKKPLTLAFSGNGSKTLSALSDSNDMIARFAKLIFDGVYEEDGGKITVIVENNPKKATCKGGILTPEKQSYDSIEGIKHTFIGDRFENLSNRKVKYSEITNDIKFNVIKQVGDFVNFIFKIHNENDNFFTKKLTADPCVLNLVKEICSDKVELEQSLKNGLDWKINSIDDGDTTVSETLFFYPLVGILHKIAKELSELKSD